MNEKLPDRWIGRGPPNMHWPAHSLDLTFCDFFLRVFIKSRVYTTQPRDITELKERIQNAFSLITDEMRRKTLLEYRARLEKVIEKNGGHDEVCYS